MARRDTMYNLTFDLAHAKYNKANYRKATPSHAETNLLPVHCFIIAKYSYIRMSIKTQNSLKIF